MAALSRAGSLRLLAAVAAVLSLAAVVGLKPALRIYRRWVELNKRRKARQLALTRRPTGAAAPRLQHLVLFSLPDLDGHAEARKRLDSLVEKFNTAFPCALTSFSSYGSKEMDKQAFHSYLQKPDFSLGLTHCLQIIADDEIALKLWLHSSIHKQEWFAAGGPFFKYCFELSSDLAVDLQPEGKEDPVLCIAFIKFQPHVTEDSEVYGGFLRLIEDFSKSPGISASLRPAGHGALIKEDLLKELQWNDQSIGMTHCLTIAADSPAQLKELNGSEAYTKWLAAEGPHLAQDGLPAAAVFYAPLKVTAKCG